MDPMRRSPGRRPERASGSLVRLLTGGTALVLLGLVPVPGGSSARADDTPAAQDKGSEARAGTESGKSATSQPSATPSPKPSPTPKQPATQAKRPAATARPAPPAQTPEPALRFDDFDLEKYHKPIPQPDDEAADDAAGPAASTGPVTGPTPPQTPAGASKRPPAKPRPKGITAQADEDPLKPYKDREAKDKFRQMQIATARERIAKLQARLDYLNAKKNALQNPAPLLAGTTRGPGTPPTPIQGPGKVAIGGFFPALPPPQTDEDKTNDKTLKVRDLIDQVDAEIKSVQDELETAQGELASVETRFAQETTGR